MGTKPAEPIVCHCQYPREVGREFSCCGIIYSEHFLANSQAIQTRISKELANWVILGRAFGIRTYFACEFDFPQFGKCEYYTCYAYVAQEKKDSLPSYAILTKGQFWLEKAQGSRIGPNAHVYKARGELARLDKDSENAINAFRQAAAVDSNDVLIWLRLAQLYENSNQMHLAISAWKQAGLIHSVSRRFYLTGAECEQRGDFLCAENYFRYTLEADTKYIDAYYALTGIYWAEWRPEDFTRMAKEILALDQSNSARRVFEEGRPALLNEQIEGAIAAFQKSLSIDPSFSIAK